MRNLSIKRLIIIILCLLDGKTRQTDGCGGWREGTDRVTEVGY